MINQIFNILFASFNSTILFIILIAFKHKILRYIGARWYYYLWFTLFIPWINIWLPFDFSLKNSPHINILLLAKHIDLLMVNFYMRFHYSLTKLMVCLWLTGACLILLYISYNHLIFMRTLKKKSIPLTLDQQKIVKDSLKNKNLISVSRIYLTSLVSSPVICHVINSRIYLPENFFSYYETSEKTYVLQHECIHFQRCDLLANAGMLFLLCLNWFNPFILYSYKYFRSAQELSCDALLSQQYSKFDVKTYSYALLKTATNHIEKSSLSCPWNSGGYLKERCLAMKLHQINPIKNLLGISLLTLTLAVALVAPSLENHLFFEDLRISNFSNKKFTAIVNFKCKNKLSAIDNNSVTLISQSEIQKFCKNSNLPSCTIEFYESDNCSGEPTVSVNLNLQGDISGIDANNKYNFNGKDHSLLIYEHFIPHSNRPNIIRTVATDKNIK